MDKFVHGAYLGKRKIGRPMKYNIRSQGRTGWVELVFNPRTQMEKYVSDAMKFAHPYIFAMTYKFHVEKAREVGKYPSQAECLAGQRARNPLPQATKMSRGVLRPQVAPASSGKPALARQAELSRLSQNAPCSDLFNYNYRHAH